MELLKAALLPMFLQTVYLFNSVFREENLSCSGRAKEKEQHSLNRFLPIASYVSARFGREGERRSSVQC